MTRGWVHLWLVGLPRNGDVDVAQDARGYHLARFVAVQLPGFVAAPEEERHWSETAFCSLNTHKIHMRMLIRL
jgi:hypothetical protein